MINLFNNLIENNYSSNSDTKYRRTLGQFFTPYKVAEFMAEWILGNRLEKINVLDPATGFGIFERAISQRNKSSKQLKFSLWEIDKKIVDELTDITRRLGIKAEINCGDFMSANLASKYDGIISNPPYYKHHYIINKKAIYKEVCMNAHFKFSLQTNIYCWFLIKSINLLADSGRLAFIIPSEFLNSNYGEKVKEYLLKTGIILHLINVSFDENVFENALTTSIIILGEKSKNKDNSIDFYNVTKTEHISNLSNFLRKHARRRYFSKDLDPKVKWRNYFNPDDETVTKNCLSPFSNFGKFSRGIATGANNYFTLTNKERKDNKIPKQCLFPCITKSSHAQDLIFGNKDFKSLLNNNKKVFLFNGEMSTSKTCTDYIKKGEKLGVDKLYLTRNRKPWYSVEKRKLSKIWVSVFGRSGLKFVWNTSKCLNLTCFHAFYPTNLGQKYLDILFLYLNTNYAKKLLNREKREYGNGLEKFEPNDINKAKVFNFDLLTNKTHEKLAKMQNKLFISDPKTRLDMLEGVSNIFNKLSQ